MTALRFTNTETLPFHELGPEALQEARMGRFELSWRHEDYLRLAERVGAHPAYLDALQALRRALRAPESARWAMHRWHDAGIWPHHVPSDPLNNPVTLPADRVLAAMSEVQWMLDHDPSSHARLMRILFDPEPGVGSEGTDEA